MKILITGAGRGIGFETALSLAEDKKTIVWAVSRNVENLAALRKTALERYGENRIETILFDLEKSPVSDLVSLMKEKAGSLDVLINNAAMALVKPFGELTEADFERMYKINVFRPALLIQQLLPLLEGKKGGMSHVVNISSIGGFQGSVKFPGLSAYSSSKAALCGLTECLAEELKDKHIAVNALCLGSVNTEMLKQAFPGYLAPVNPEQMGRYIAWFAVNGHIFQNGKVIPVSLSTP
jgi:NAD(P)-dependent dehydrogenase (short-subunit alcohol dehydrogenase family)